VLFFVPLIEVLLYHFGDNELIIEPFKNAISVEPFSKSGFLISPQRALKKLSQEKRCQL
jgi:hypothetical protein